MHPPTRRPRHEGGAAAVEFALVSGVLFLLLFGMIQYGLWFNDSLSTRQGVREAARHAVVESFGYDSSCTAGANSARLRCSARKDIGPVTGTSYVKVDAASWQKGKAVTVCAMVKTDSGLGLLPLPHHGWITSRTQMSIEQVTQAGAWTNTADTLPSGMTWDWCT